MSLLRVVNTLPTIAKYRDTPTPPGSRAREETVGEVQRPPIANSLSWRSCRKERSLVCVPVEILLCSGTYGR
jgi:hypothetical protein